MCLPCLRLAEGVRFQTLRPAHRLTQRAMNFGAIRFGEQSDPSDMGLGPTDPRRAPIKNRPEIVRGRTSQVAGAAMTLCSRMLISLSILASACALVSVMVRPSPVRAACPDSPAALADCWGSATATGRFRKTTAPSGAVHLTRTNRGPAPDVVPPPPPRPKDLARRAPPVWRAQTKG